MSSLPDREPTYRAAAQFVDQTLRTDGSLFTPGMAVWTPATIEDLARRFIDHPDEGKGTFLDKLKLQLLEVEGRASDTVIQLAAEFLYFYYLAPTPESVGGQTKRRNIETVLSWASSAKSIPEDAAPALDCGIASFGSARNWQFQSFAFLLGFFRTWKALPDEARRAMLQDPWAFKSLVLKSGVAGSQTEQAAFLHFVFPETFEPIVSAAMKEKIVRELSASSLDSRGDVDRELLAIRQQLTPKYDEDFTFWDPPIKSLWDPELSAGPPWQGQIRDWVTARNLPDEPADSVIRFFTKAISSIPAEVVPRVWIRVVRDLVMTIGHYYVASVEWSGRSAHLSAGLMIDSPIESLAEQISEFSSTTSPKLYWCKVQSHEAIEELLDNPEVWDSYRRAVTAATVAPQGKGDYRRDIAGKQPLAGFLAAGDRGAKTWLFQANPAMYDLAGALQELPTQHFRAAQHASNIKPGDRVFLWESGPHAGLLATAWVSDGPARMADGPEELQFYRQPPEDTTERVQVLLQIERVLPTRIPRQRFLDDPRFKNWSFLKSPQGTNFAVSADEATAILDLIGDIVTDRSFGALRAALASRGLHFSTELVSTYLLALQTKRFVILTGISGTGKTQLAVAVAEFFGQPFRDSGPPLRAAEDTEQDGTLTVVPVRSDWTDTRGLLGYLNPLTETYETTRFLDLVLRAQEEELAAQAEGRSAQPYFVVLDEMNLARVEYYFSDYLSALESSKPIPLHSNDHIAAQSTRPIPRDLRLPGNLFITGTVNIDETTSMFSPKVLDRAFTIEFNTVDLQGYGGVPSGQGDGLSLDQFCGTLLPAPPPHYSLWDRTRPSAQDWNDFCTMADGALRSSVLDIHSLLLNTNHHFGYRVANEIARFVRLASEQAGGSSSAEWAALDLALLQKVLPKFHGTQQELQEPLSRLLVYALEGTAQESASPEDILSRWRFVRGQPVPATDATPAEARFPRLATKLHRMLERLRAQGYAAFLE